MNVEESIRPIKEESVGKEESIEKLLEEIISTVKPSASTSTQGTKEKIPNFLLEANKFRIPRGRVIPLALSLIFLGGVLLGTVFGYYWGKNQLDNPTDLEAIDTKCEFIMNEIKEIRQTLQCEPPLNEIIQPLNPSQKPGFSELR